MQQWDKNIRLLIDKEGSLFKADYVRIALRPILANLSVTGESSRFHLTESISHPHIKMIWRWSEDKHIHVLDSTALLMVPVEEKTWSGRYMDFTNFFSSESMTEELVRTQTRHAEWWTWWQVNLDLTIAQLSLFNDSHLKSHKARRNWKFSYSWLLKVMTSTDQLELILYRSVNCQSHSSFVFFIDCWIYSRTPNNCIFRLGDETHSKSLLSRRFSPTHKCDLRSTFLLVTPFLFECTIHLYSSALGFSLRTS